MTSRSVGRILSAKRQVGKPKYVVLPWRALVFRFAGVGISDHVLVIANVEKCVS